MQTEKKKPKRSPSELVTAPDPSEALRIQEMLRHHCIIERTVDICEIRYVAGADASYDKDTIYAAIVVMKFPGLEVVEKTCSVQEVSFPYIPGLLSFREGPAILEAFSSLTTSPDIIFMNGHGYAHPKRFGLASHVGLLLDIPSIGVAKRLLIGEAALPDAARGSTEPVLENGEIIGKAVRTVQDAKPVFVSAGHKVDLAQAVDMALKTTTIHRITEPLWHADHLSRQFRICNPALKPPQSPVKLCHFSSNRLSFHPPQVYLIPDPTPDRVCTGYFSSPFQPRIIITRHNT